MAQKKWVGRPASHGRRSAPTTTLAVFAFRRLRPASASHSSPERKRYIVRRPCGVAYSGNGDHWAITPSKNPGLGGGGLPLALSLLCILRSASGVTSLPCSQPDMLRGGHSGVFVGTVSWRWPSGTPRASANRHHGSQFPPHSAHPPSVTSDFVLGLPRRPIHTRAPSMPLEFSTAFQDTFPHPTWSQRY